MKFRIIMSLIAVIVIGALVILYEASTSSAPVHKNPTTSAPSKNEDAMKGLKF